MRSPSPFIADCFHTIHIILKYRAESETGSQLGEGGNIFARRYSISIKKSDTK